jgi:DNA-binding beta-propeller fold protein YncE
MLHLAIALAFGIAILGQPSPSSSAGAGPYHVAETFSVGGEGSWDYLCLDPDGKRLFVPRGSHTMVLDAQTGKTLGDIPETTGVHGVALAMEFGKGFTSNGRAGTVTVFDLKDYKTLGTVKVGDNPDSILFEPTTKRVFVFQRQEQGRDRDRGGGPEGGGHHSARGQAGVLRGRCAGKVFVNIEDTSELVRLDAKSMKVEERWKLAPGAEPSGLAFDVAHKRLFRCARIRR